MHKNLTNVTIKDADKGIVSAVFSTFGVIDLDGDVTSKAAFTEGAAVVVSSYGHTSWDGDLPIGKGVIRTTDTEAIAELQFFLNTTHGKDAFTTVKELSEAGLQEWSYSLHDVVSKRGELDGRPANFIESVNVKEVSPVLKGASIGTRTLAVKSNKFSEQSDIALRGVKQLVEMAVERLTLRAAEGKSITEQQEALDQLMAEIAPLQDAVDAVSKASADATQTNPEDDEALANEFLRFVALTQGVNA